MKLRFIDPNQILGVVLSLMVLGIGVFASFTVFANIPTSTPAGSANRAGSGSITNTANIHLDVNATTRWISTPNYINNTAVCLLYGLTCGDTPHTFLIQDVGAVNGTFIAGNSTYRFDSWPHFANSSYTLVYSTTTGVTTALTNSTYTAVINVSGTSTSVFNIIGVVLIIAAIMSIIGLIYTYVRPKT